MNIRNRREMKAFASGRLENARDFKKIVLIYSALTLGLSALVTVANYVLGLQIDKLSGLSSFSTRTMLSTIQSMTPIALNLVTMCLELGLLAVMLRVARGQYVSEQTLRLGFDRFWTLLRAKIFMGLMYLGELILSVYLGIMLFMALPISDAAMEILTPYIAQMSALSNEIVLSDGDYVLFAQAVWPAYVLCGGFFLLLCGPIWYNNRMVNYVIIDKPGMGALAALGESRKMMRGNRISLLKLDVSLWWYYLALLGAQALCYGDVILPLLGISLPGNGDIWYFVFLAVYLAALLAVYLFLRGKVEVSYALAYDSLKPEEPKNNGVVLGNIFQM